MRLTRRNLLKCAGQAALASAAGISAASAKGSPAAQSDAKRRRKPNVIIALADQWRAQATGYGGDPNVQTPQLDALAGESLDFTNAVSGCPVCSPYRGSLLTGQYPLTHGVFVNDVCLSRESVSLAECFAAAGYDTAYIGKWHVDGHGRSSRIPRERRRGFDYWKALECTHDYNHSPYFAGNSREKGFWDGYDAEAQTRDAEDYIRSRDGDKPFLLVLAWGPPHNPYETAPESYRRMYSPDSITLRTNVPPGSEKQAREDLAGYYAHCSALDACVGSLLRVIAQQGMADDTVFVFTSDHGDMLGSQGQQRKQRPWDESVRVPLLLRYPGMHGSGTRQLDAPIDAPDIMPTLLGICGLPSPAAVEGLDFSGYIRGGKDPSDGAALLACYHTFGEWLPARDGGREYRGVRSRKYTYVRSLDGPWLLFNNREDPYQMANLVDDPSHSNVRSSLDRLLTRKLERAGDEFLPGMHYIRKWGYSVDATGTVPASP